MRTTRTALLIILLLAAAGRYAEQKKTVVARLLGEAMLSSIVSMQSGTALTKASSRPAAVPAKSAPVEKASEPRPHSPCSVEHRLAVMVVEHAVAARRPV